MRICPGSGMLDFEDRCIRAAWSSLIPGAFVLLVLLSTLPVPLRTRVTSALQTLQTPFRRFLTLDEAEALLYPADAEESVSQPPKAPFWRTLLLSSVCIAEIVAWTILGASTLVVSHSGEDLLRLTTWSPFIIALSWIYSALRLVLRPLPTPSYDLFVLWIMHFLAALLGGGSVLYERAAHGQSFPTCAVEVFIIFNIVAVGFLLVAMFSMPIAIPSKHVDVSQIGKRISPEDYTTLFGWASFRWVYPLIKRGTTTTLNESDVWALSVTMQSKPLFMQFSSLKRSASLVRRLWKANSSDLLLDFGLTFVSVVCNYCGPYFLKRILEAIDNDATPEARAKAYIFALLSFSAALLKGQSDIQHLWFGRRASTRIKSSLMASIYDKALKRKDFSGIVDKAQTAEKREVGGKNGAKASNGKAAGKGDAPKTGADLGKIVNLMAADSNRVGNMVSGAYFIYGAPFEIIIACVFLYQLLGWSAFAGFTVLVVASPGNTYLARRGIRIQRSILAARDKRMGVLNELISEVKFIKFFAWEDRWIARALAARQVLARYPADAQLTPGPVRAAVARQRYRRIYASEIPTLTNPAERINSVLFSLLWSCAPVLVSVVSFTTYISLGNELTVPIAFTAIALFSMLRTPLNVIPTQIQSILNTAVALDRIATFLKEDEVIAQISSLKRDETWDSEDELLGIATASFKWNEAIDPVKNEKQKKLWFWQRRHAQEVSDTSSTIAASITGSPEKPFELRDISAMFPVGRLTLVTGSTASGKTALLMALLGEMTQTSLNGRIFIPKNLTKLGDDGLFRAVSYAAQKPWLQHMSIKDNILFGSPYEEERYQEVLECCALKPDLAILESGDLTEIGVRGVSLSGGQKARVALARAVYQRTKHVLLDDPLSAVDSHTARFLFDRLLCGPLLANRTVVLVTHHVELVLPRAHYLVRMLDGRIETLGTVVDLKSQGILENIAHDAAAKAAQATSATVKKISSTGAVETTDTKPRQMVKDEARAEGSVKWNVYRSYISASSPLTWVVVLFIILTSQVLGVVEKLWIKTWGEAYGDTQLNATLPASAYFTSLAITPNENAWSGAFGSHHAASVATANWPSWSDNLPPATTHPYFYVAVYAAITLGAALLGVTGGIVQFMGSYRASKFLFKQLLTTVIHAPFRWHDVTPAGRLLNRFSRDIETVDSSLAGSLRAVLAQLATFLAAVVTISVVLPGFLIPATVIAYMYWTLAVGYLNTGRDLRRMESVTRSPIFAGFAETLDGLVTVRAFGVERRFLNNLHGKIDLTTQMWYSTWMLNRWLLLRFDMLGACAVLITTLFGLAAMQSSGFAGWAGLTITTAMTLTSSVYWTCRFVTQLELDLNSVERVVEFLDLPQEPPAIIEDHRPPAYWPSSNDNEAMLVVDNLVVRYAPDLPAVLHGVTFSLRARERVGLLGRTGSGKSTLATSLLRFVEPSEGKIFIDGIDVSTIGLTDLRSKLTFIPQDAALFSGTVRDNLDPFNDHTDAACLDALIRVQLISESSTTVSRRSSRPPSISGSATGSNSATGSLDAASTQVDDGKVVVTLDTKVSAGGANFSQGQRQLLALARALLRQNNVIILDEATSSIDFATDAKIQATIRDEFRNSLLLTVAHRLRTIIDYDRLIVLDQGKVVEFDTPLNLIHKEGGYFRNMCLQSGTFTELEAAAAAGPAK